MLLRIKALEDRQKPSLTSLKKAVTQYCLRPLSDFDKYKAVDMVEQLANVSLQVKDKKADYYATVYSTLQERISKSAEQFKSYVLSLLGDREYEKVVESLAKVDKAFRTRPLLPGLQLSPSHPRVFCPLTFLASCHLPLATLVFICMLHTLFLTLPITTTADTRVPEEAVVFFTVLFVVEADILCTIALLEWAHPGDSLGEEL